MIKHLYTKRVFLQLVKPSEKHNMLNDRRLDGLQHKDMDFKKESGRRLQQARERKGWKLRELASKVKGVSESRISNYEQGLRLMRQPEAIKLAAVLDVSAAYLMCVDEGSGLPPREQRLLNLFDAADARGKRTIEQVAETEAQYNGSQNAPDNVVSITAA